MLKLNELASSLDGEAPLFHWQERIVKGKARNLAAPNEAMRRLHARLMFRLSKAASTNRALLSAYGSVKGRSALMNAAQHVYGRYFYQLDIQNAFSSVPVEKLADALYLLDPTLGSTKEILAFLLTYCAGKEWGEGLAVGAPASPLLFNLYCAATIDERVRRLVPQPCNVYTRYLDDLTVSSDRPIPGILRRRIREAVTSAGFAISRHKSSVTDLRCTPVTITGVLVTRKGKMRPTDEYMRKAAEALRKPLDEMVAADAYAFNGLVSYLLSFGRYRGRKDDEYPWDEISEDALALKERCQKRLERLVKRGLLSSAPRRQTRDRIPQWFLDELQRVAAIEEVSGWYTDLKKRPISSEYKGLSPFNREKTPSFMVSPTKTMFFDFSSGIHGNIFELVARMEKVSFPKAVRIIAERYGLNMPT